MPLTLQIVGYIITLWCLVILILYFVWVYKFNVNGKLYFSLNYLRQINIKLNKKMVKSFTKIFVLFTLIALIATSIPLSAWVTYIMIWYKKFLDWNIADFVIINVFGYSFIFLILTSSIRIIWMFIELLTLKHNNDLILLEDKIKNSELSNLQLNFENIYKINFDNNEINRYIMYPKTLKIKNVSKYSKLITYWNAIQPYEKCELVDFDNQLLTFGNIYDEFKKYDWFKNI